MKEEDIAVSRDLAEKYILTRGGGEIAGQLGDGGSAVVFKWLQVNETYALKVYDKRFFNSENAPAERYRLQLQRRLIGNHCDALVDTLSVEEDLDTCFLVMEYFCGSELKKVIGSVPDGSVSNLIRQLVSAVRFLETYGLVHRDIKPENILISSDFNVLKLIDFGVIREISGEEDRVGGTDQGDSKPFIATAQYSSPEYLFRLEPPSADLWKALTLYQLGGVLHDLVCKRQLFEKSVAADNKYALAMAVMRETPSFEGASSSLADWTSLSARCLSKNSTLRLCIVDWIDFEMEALSPAQKLKSLLQKHAVKADRALLDETRLQTLARGRSTRTIGIVKKLVGNLIGEFSPHLRVTEQMVSERMAGIYLTISEGGGGVQVSVEFDWREGLHDELATVSVKASVNSSAERVDYEGESYAVGEVDLDGVAEEAILQLLLNCISQIVVMYSALSEIVQQGDGTDLVHCTWNGSYEGGGNAK